ncbi:hypothetical protein TNCV_2795761 [Trichonephila clavipes]|nr:hypothetical protein TNCV_2795761 [Trichonephila clavipes]
MLPWGSPDSSSIIVRTQLEARFIAKQYTSPVIMIQDPSGMFNEGTKSLLYFMSALGLPLGTEAPAYFDKEDAQRVMISDARAHESTLFYVARIKKPFGTLNLPLVKVSDYVRNHDFAKRLDE